MGGQAPIIIEADKILRADGFIGAEFLGKFSGCSEIPPVGVGDEACGSPETPDPVQPAAFGSERTKAFMGLDTDEFDL